MARISAGLLMHRTRGPNLEVFLVHPGGPFFAKRDEGVWSIPKGEVDEGEDLLQAAIREFEEEIGFRPKGPFQKLGFTRQKGGKVVHAWALEAERDPGQEMTSNSFELEWPPHSGRMRSFPEVDRGGFFGIDEARKKLNSAQHVFLDRLLALRHSPGSV
ncbi:MAG: NUDIX domain-containing protein [Acidobacteriota bacterium]|jgi:predicted NUDIX family NTP pyrophosphohydrolase